MCDAVKSARGTPVGATYNQVIAAASAWMLARAEACITEVQPLSGPPDTRDGVSRVITHQYTCGPAMNPPNCRHDANPPGNSGFGT